MSRADHPAEPRRHDDHRAGWRTNNNHVDFVHDEISDRFRLLGIAQDHIDKLTLLKDLGVDQFAAYVMHDSKEETLRQYGEIVIPALREHVMATS